jgi:hypothetical protein
MVLPEGSPLGFSGPRLPPSRSHVSGSSSHELPASFRDPLGHDPRDRSPTTSTEAQAVETTGTGVPPMRFPAPPAHEPGESVIVPVPPGTPSLHGLSQTLEGFILTEPRGLVPCHRRSWGFHSSGRSPAADLLRARRSKIPSRRFPGHSEELPTAPPGPFIPRQSVASSGVLHPPATRCPLELSVHLCGIWRPGLEPSPRRQNLRASGSSAHDLPTKPFTHVFIRGLQRLPTGAPDNPLSREAEPLWRS